MPIFGVPVGEKKEAGRERLKDWEIKTRTDLRGATSFY